MEISKPYKGKGKRKLRKMPFTPKGYILYLFWQMLITFWDSARNILYSYRDRFQPIKGLFERFRADLLQEFVKVARIIIQQLTL